MYTTLTVCYIQYTTKEYNKQQGFILCTSYIQPPDVLRLPKWTPPESMKDHGKKFVDYIYRYTTYTNVLKLHKTL